MREGGLDAGCSVQALGPETRTREVTNIVRLMERVLKTGGLDDGGLSWYDHPEKVLVVHGYVSSNGVKKSNGKRHFVAW